MRPVIALCLALLAACKPTPPATPSIDVRDAWARETAPGQTSAAIYLTIVNAGGQSDRLISVSTPRAPMAMLHSSSEAGGIMTMRIARDLAVPGTETVFLAPLGAHIMLTGLAAPLRKGERVPLTLTFALAGARQVDAAVLPAGSNGPSH